MAVKVVLQGQEVDISGKQDKLTFDTRPTENSENPAKSGGIFNALQEKPNPNLLINPYFVGGGSQQSGTEFPINRNKQIEYTEDGQSTIDFWKINIADSIKLEKDGVLLSRIEDANNSPIITQDLDVSKFIDGATYTLSLLIDFIEGSSASLSMFQDKNGWAANGEHYFTLIPGKYLLTNSAVWDKTNTLAYFSIAVNEGSAKIYAAKLELGDTQTLAHQDEEGNWVLNEIPNYAEEYLKCSLYDPNTGEFIGNTSSGSSIVTSSESTFQKLLTGRLI